MWVDRWTDGEDMIYCITDNSQWSSLLSPLLSSLLSSLLSPLPSSHDSDNCKSRKSTVKKGEKKYWDNKAKKIEKEEDLIEKAKKKRKELNPMAHAMLSKIIKKRK